MRPADGEYNPYFGRYISLVPGDRVIPVLAEQVETFKARFGHLTEEQGGFRYAEGKWTVREVIGHLIDTERVFAFRALWFARGDVAPLPGFEQDDFAATAGHDQLPVRELVEEFCALRTANLMMLKHFPKEAWTRIGAASNHPMSTRAAVFIMAGHLIYHSNHLREHYGV